MKKVLSFLLLFYISTFSWAQLNRGDIVPSLNIDFGYNSSNTDNVYVGSSTNQKSSNFGIGLVPGLGYNITHNIQAGVYIGINAINSSSSSTNVTFSSDTKEKQKGLLLIPYGRYYIESTEDLSFFFEGNFAYGIGKLNSTSSSRFSGTTSSTNLPEEKVHSYLFNIKPGAQLMLGDFALEINICLYSIGVVDYKTDTNSSNQFVSGFFNSSTPFSLGGKYYF